MTFNALNSLICAGVRLRTYSLTQVNDVFKNVFLDRMAKINQTSNRQLNRNIIKVTLEDFVWHFMCNDIYF